MTFKKASDIAEYLTELLGTIRVSNGYLTDLGTRVYRGKLKHDEDKVPYCVLIEGADRPGTTSGVQDVSITQQYEIGAYVTCDPDNPNDAAHQAIKDIKKCVFSSDLARSERAGARGFNGRVKDLEYVGKGIGPRADGAAIVFAVVDIRVTFAENLLDA